MHAIVRRKVSPVVIVLCLVVVVAGGIIGGVYLYHHADPDDYPTIRPGMEQAEMMAMLSGLCFATAVAAAVVALWLAVRERSRRQSLKVLFPVGGALLFLAVVFMPRAVWGLQYEHDEFGFIYIGVFGNILLAAAGLTLVAVAVVLALMDARRHKEQQSD